jgi:two-component system cell cycle response regulator DivK
MAKTVMIVEDNELNMKLFNDLLRANGYSTLPMRNGYDALDALKVHDEERIRQGGCEGYLSKPISVATFMETVKSYVGEA